MELAQKSGEMNFSLYDRGEDPLVEGVIQLQHLGSMLEHTDNNWTVVQRNIGKRDKRICTGMSYIYLRDQKEVLVMIETVRENMEGNTPD